VRLQIDYYEFPMIDGRIIPKGKRYYATVDVEENDDEKIMLNEVYNKLSSTIGVSRDRLKVMSWEKL
jgi:hypothetical protein